MSILARIIPPLHATKLSHDRSGSCLEMHTEKEDIRQMSLSLAIENKAVITAHQL